MVVPTKIRRNDPGGSMPADDGAATITVDGTKDGRRGERQVDRRMLIDGGLVGAEHEQTFASFNPATGKIVGYAPNATVPDAEKAVAAARHAFDTTGWSTDVELRVRCLDQLYKALVDRSEELRELTIAEVGAPSRRADPHRPLLRRLTQDLSDGRGTR
jgi:aldehyde dehydrogenase (NAD+)